MQGAEAWSLEAGTLEAETLEADVWTLEAEATISCLQVGPQGLTSLLNSISSGFCQRRLGRKVLW